MALIPIVQNLKLSGSKTMNVDGSSASKVFSYSPGSGIVGITSLCCLLRDEGITSFNKFGAITGLTNGFDVKVTIDGVTTTITNIKDNADLTTRFYRNQFGNSAVLSILSVVTPQGFGNTSNVFVGFLEFNERILLTDSDSISVTVQDNLTNVDLLEMTCIGVQTT